MTLGALEIGFVGSLTSARKEIIGQLCQLATILEDLGYARYWIAEHHSSWVVHSSPDMLLPVLLGATRRIKIGTGGILLRFRNPLRVAKDFRLLNCLYPGRVELGLARGGPSKAVAQLLSKDDPEGANYGETVAETLYYLCDAGAPIICPENDSPPDVWLLGSNIETLRLAASLG